jgi:glycosyltransferase involved in cell wall biosynthesis
MTQLAESYDLVIAFVTSAQLTPVVFGRLYAEQHNTKFAIYSVDAIPAPGGWTKPREYHGKMRIVARNFAAADYVASSNAHMLAFQLTTFKHKEGLRSNVLLTPSPAKEYNLPEGERATLLYTGSLYGLRNPDYFFKAFKRLLRDYPDAEAIFVGMGMKFRNMRSILSAEELKRVTVLNHTDNLEPLFRRATVLVDINADRESDPFLSSKIITYLKTNRMIICETGGDTPSREVFAGLDTIILADHSAESLYEAMTLAVERAHSKPDFSERAEVIRRFSIEEVGEILRHDIVDICK